MKLHTRLARESVVLLPTLLVTFQFWEEMGVTRFIYSCDLEMELSDKIEAEKCT